MIKKIVIILLLIANCQLCFSQTQEAKQLLLDVEKLAQFKQILKDLKKGYQILSGGYEAIKNISHGNFNLHQTFLDGLLQVSPAVQHYKRIADIIQLQLRIVREYRTAWNQFRSDGHFTIDEIDYMGKVYRHLFTESVSNLDDLITVITAGKLRMSDDERLKAIDKVWDEVQDQYAFLRDFNSSTSMLSMARAKEQEEVDVSRRLRGR